MFPVSIKATAAFQYVTLFFAGYEFLSTGALWQDSFTISADQTTTTYPCQHLRQFLCYRHFSFPMTPHGSPNLFQMK